MTNLSFLSHFAYRWINGFGNARWSFNHPSGRKAKVAAKDDKDTTHLPQADTRLTEEILSNRPQKREFLGQLLLLQAAAKRG